MKLDPAICETAFTSKDPRFDGRFFVGVRSTAIYCRPVCPAPAPKLENVAFYATAAAAAAAGLRPCLRCRPERAPHLWPSSGAGLLRRALATIEGDPLEQLRVDTLAAALGVSPRQLTRIFRRHLGAAPGAVISTHRLQHAKRLLDETRLSITDVAFAAGFGSLRRFNAVFKTTYGRPPSALRRHPSRPADDRAIELELAYTPPFDWTEMLSFLSRRCLAGVEVVVHGCYRRAIRTRHGSGTLEVCHQPGTGTLRLAIVFPETRGLVEVVERVRNMLDLRVDPAAIHRHLVADELLAPALAGRALPRVPMSFGGFEALVRAILGQGVSVASATARAVRVVAAAGSTLDAAQTTGGLLRLFPTPEELLHTPPRIPGVAPATLELLRRVAAAVLSGELALESGVDPDRVRASLTAIRGIGPWTAESVALRGLGDPDAFPATDLGLLQVTGMSAAQLLRRAERWRPWRGYAAMALWRLHGERRMRRGPAGEDTPDGR